MNKTEKQITKYQLQQEQKTLRELKQVYAQASKDLQKSINDLNLRTDMQNLQSIIYQVKYQEAMKKKIDGILDKLNKGSYQTINEYLQDAYHNGYIGNMYSLQKQGIPITVPIDQKKVLTALQTDSKLSSKYHSGDVLKGRLAEDVKKLKVTIRAELSRGIANGETWQQVAYKIALGMNNPMSKALNMAMRIARTEGHRVNQQGFLDAGTEAKKKGADIVKQWDATLDSVTRPWHQEADGQIREWDDFFEVGGEKMKAPSIGGSARNVCNCRCQLLQRAKWALDESELKTLQDRASFFGLDKSKSFEDFKKKYLKLPDKADTMNLEDVYDKPAKLGGLSSYPKKYHSQITNFLDEAPDVCRKAWNDVCEDFHTITGVEYKNKTGRRATGAFYSSYVDAVYLNITKASQGSSYQTPFQVVFHEFGHHMDFIFNRKYGNGDNTKGFSETYKNGIFGQTLKKEAKQAILDFAKSKGITDSSEAEREFIKDVSSKYSLIARSDISDMFEPVTTKDYPFGVGHGKSYWKKRDNGKEGFAEMYSAMVNSPESWKAINEYFPESVKIFEEMLKVVK